MFTHGKYKSIEKRNVNIRMQSLSLTSLIISLHFRANSIFRSSITGLKKTYKRKVIVPGLLSEKEYQEKEVFFKATGF